MSDRRNRSTSPAVPRDGEGLSSRNGPAIPRRQKLHARSPRPAIVEVDKATSLNNQRACPVGTQPQVTEPLPVHTPDSPIAELGTMHLPESQDAEIVAGSCSASFTSRGESPELPPIGGPKGISTNSIASQTETRDTNDFRFDKTNLRDLKPFEESVVVWLEITKRYMKPIAFIAAFLLAVLFLISPSRDSIWKFFVHNYKPLLSVATTVWTSKEGIKAYRNHREKMKLGSLPKPPPS